MESSEIDTEATVYFFGLSVWVIEEEMTEISSQLSLMGTDEEPDI